LVIFAFSSLGLHAAMANFTRITYAIVFQPKSHTTQS